MIKRHLKYVLCICQGYVLCITCLLVNDLVQLQSVPTHVNVSLHIFGESSTFNYLSDLYLYSVGQASLVRIFSSHSVDRSGDLSFCALAGFYHHRIFHFFNQTSSWNYDVGMCLHSLLTAL